MKAENPATHGNVNSTEFTRLLLATVTLHDCRHYFCAILSRTEDVCFLRIVEASLRQDYLTIVASSGVICTRTPPIPPGRGVTTRRSRQAAARQAEATRCRCPECNRSAGPRPGEWPASWR